MYLINKKGIYMKSQSKIKVVFLTGVLVGTVLAASTNFLTQKKLEAKTPPNQMTAADVVKRFNQIFYNNELCWTETKWLGVNAWQNPCDNWVMQEIISDIKPDLIIETGTYKGGTSLFYASILNYVNKDGKLYKKQGYWGYFIWCNTRTVIPPLGAWPGYEDQMYRKVTVFRSPLEAKGLGGFNIRYYNDSEKYDEGYYYHPAFKKTGRSNATTWMNNAGGTDYTYGDGMGLQDPMSDWDFKFVGTKYMLHTEYVAPAPIIDDMGRPLETLQSDVGDKFPRFGFTVLPFHVIEGIPVIKHVYGKKMLYVNTYLYNKAESAIPMMDAYDRQMVLWKHYTLYNGIYDKEKHYAVHVGCDIWDLQSRHNTTYWFDMNINAGLKPKDCSLKALLAKGR